MPRGECLLRSPELLAIHTVSDGLIALACFAIPLCMLRFLAKRQDIQDNTRRIAYLFVALILAYAVMHLTALLTLCWPAFGLLGLVKAITALISIAAAIAVWRMFSLFLTLPSLKELERANDHLKAENLQLDTRAGKSQRELNRINDRFEKALTGSNISVFSQDKDLRYTWVHNPRLSFTPSEIVGKTDLDVLDPDTAHKVIELKKTVMQTGETASTFIHVENDETGTVFLDLIIHPTVAANGEIDGVLCTAVDMTEKNLYEIRLASMASQLSVANTRLEKALDGSLITVFEQDCDQAYVDIINPPDGMEVSDFVGKTDADLFSEEDQLKLMPPKARVIETGESDAFEVDIDLGGRSKNYSVRLDPAVDRNGNIYGLIGAAVDLTHKRDNERQMHLVMRELTHRSKNLLAVIQAMARQTAAKSDNTEDFVESFSARLQAMAASHDLLVSQSWYGADFRELILTHLGQSIDPSGPQIELKGDSCSVTADAAQNLGLALHELTTNAAKYGALSVLDGKLSLTWERVDGNVRLSWVESNGPVVVEPTRNGFGRMLLEQLVGAALDGTVTIEFAPEGLRCVIEFPEKHIVKS